jgi:hypothetical protein
VAIKTKLERVLGPRMPGKLGIEDPIAPFPERRGLLDALQKIGNPMPFAGEKTA